MEWCHLSTGSWLATTVKRSPERSSTTSNRSRQVSTAAGLSKKSSIYSEIEAVSQSSVACQGENTRVLRIRPYFVAPVWGLGLLEAISRPAPCVLGSSAGQLGPAAVVVELQ